MPLRFFGDQAGDIWTGLQRALKQSDFDLLIKACYEWIETGDSYKPAHLIEYLLAEELPIAKVLDHVVGPVMHKIGIKYIEGTVSIGDEHRMTQCMRDVLVALSVRKRYSIKQNGKKQHIAIVGCVRGEAHELGALMVRLVLENLGWKVVYLGLNVPTEDFVTQQEEQQADLVCISIMPPMGVSEAQGIIQLLDRMCDPEQPYRLAIGGSLVLSSDNTVPQTRCLDAAFFNRMQPFSDWLTD